MSDKLYKIKLTLENGQTAYWKKRGQVHLLPGDAVEVWLKNFKPDVFVSTADGDMVGVCRPSAEPTYKIVKIEKEESDSN